MIDFVITKLHDTKFLIMLLTSVAAIATVITLAMPLLSPDTLGRWARSRARPGAPGTIGISGPNALGAAAHSHASWPVDVGGSGGAHAAHGLGGRAAS